MKTRHARLIRRAIFSARRHKPWPYRFTPGYGFLPTESALYMAAWKRSGGDDPPRNPPRGSSGVSRP